jgi:hypothetical protein
MPLIVVTVTICAAMNKRTEETLWFCAIASVIIIHLWHYQQAIPFQVLGAFGKVLAIIIFSSIFGFTRGIDVENRRRGMQSPQSKDGKQFIITYSLAFASSLIFIVFRDSEERTLADPLLHRSARGRSPIDGVNRLHPMQLQSVQKMFPLGLVSFFVSAIFTFFLSFFPRALFYVKI